ncbi:MAG: DUF3352 domain-containing protein [Bacteroidales bacterium]|nr:DUF3352 domain-containing protein [Bacteroidales bacterium]
MQRKFILIIVIACLLGISILTFVFLRSRGEEKIEAVRAIPSDVALVVQVKHVEDAADLFSSDNEFWTKLSDLEMVERCRDFVLRMNSVLQSNNKSADFKDLELFFVVKKLGVNKLDFVFILSSKEKMKVANVKTVVEKAFQISSPSNYDYKGETIYVYENETSERKSLAFSVCDGLLVLGESKVSVETSIRSYKDDTNLKNDRNFDKIKPNLSDVSARLFVNYDKMAEIYQLYASNDVNSRVNKFPRIANWSVLDVSAENKIVRANGFVTLDTLEPSVEYMNLFVGQSSKKGDILSVLPYSTSYFVSMHISDKDKFLENYKLYLQKNNFYRSYESTVADLGQSFVKSFYKLLDTEMAFAMMPACGENNKYENSYAVLKVSSPKDAEDLLQTRVGSYSVYSSQLSSEYKIFTLYDTLANIPQKLFGNIFYRVSGTFATVVDSYLVFSNSDRAIKMFIDDKEKEQILTKNDNFRDFNDKVKSSYSLYAYMYVPQSVDVIKDFWGPMVNSVVNACSDTLQAMNSISYQLTADNDVKFYTEFLCSFEKTKVSKPTYVRFLLDSTAIGKPTIFFTHRDEYVTLVQDESYRLYMIDNEKKDNRVLWSAVLDGPIVGDIHFVDIMKNHKQQYLFNTEKTIYLYDRNGNKHFSVNLSSPATADIAVFDYDNSKKYRIAVPCADSSIRLYSFENGLCNSLQWNAKAEGVVRNPLVHFASEGKDYILYSDQYHIYIVNRKGDERVAVSDIIERAQNSAIIFDEGADATLSRFILTDVYGVVKEIYLDGSVKSSDEFGKRSENHIFFAKDIDEDGNLDFVFADENKLVVYNQSGKKMFSYSAANTITTVKVKMVGDKLYFCLVDEKNKLYVLKSNGSLEKGFPIEGKSNFDIGANHSGTYSFDLVVGGEQKMLYYYTVK